VPDIDRALAEIQAQGAVLDPGITPEGVGEIAEFWDGGIRYVFLSGPEGARIELCQRKIGPLAQTGHDHVGIPCRDISAMQGFFEAQGAKLMSAVDLVRADGIIPVRFLAFAGGVIELYAPQTAAHPERGLWSRLLVEGLAAKVTGPDGLILAPL
jgi:catechol 2,3-dioxygenase-like lactoylglutathione lyase family enzyme